MVKEFINTTVFDKRWSELKLTDENLRNFQNQIMENPYIGDIIVGTGGAIKVRFALPGTGKSGGIRVIYVDLIRAEKIYFLTCYSKSEKDNLSDSEKSAIKEVAKRIIKE